VTIHIRTAEEYIPVTQEEIFEAKREGVRIKGLRTPVGLTVEGNRLTGIEFVRTASAAGAPAGAANHPIEELGSSQALRHHHHCHRPADGRRFSSAPGWNSTAGATCASGSTA
jgi:hypothetical protein